MDKESSQLRMEEDHDDTVTASDDTVTASDQAVTAKRSSSDDDKSESQEGDKLKSEANGSNNVKAGMVHVF